MAYTRVQISMSPKLLGEVDRERGSISRSRYIRAILEKTRLSDRSIKDLAEKEEARIRRARGKNGGRYGRG